MTTCIDYDDPMMEPTARGHILARAPISIIIQADTTGLRLLAHTLPEELASALDGVVPHPAPRASLIATAAKIGALIRLASAEGYTIAVRRDDASITLDMTP